ncbi:MAG: response regulator [Thermoflexales bacterium]|nr:response regulator [Thermoflexales bacterium]
MSQSVSVLIVASPGRLRDGLSVLLQASGFVTAIEQVDDGQAALRTIAQHPPQLVLLDAGLADNQVWQTLQQIRAGWPHVRCCVLVHTSGQMNKAHTAGADAVIQAGFSVESFFKTLADLMPST